MNYTGGMDNSASEWLDKLQHATLPAMGLTVTELKRLANTDHLPLEQTIRVIERDPGMALRLLQHIGKLRGKQQKNEIVSVHHAALMLGRTALHGLGDNLPIIEQLTPEIRQRLLGRFNEAYHAAHQAREWGRRSRDNELDELFLGALLHNLAEMLLVVHAPRRMAKLRELKHQQGMEPQEAEYISFGINFDELSRGLAGRWGLPSLLSDSLEIENARRRRVMGVMLSAQLGRVVNDFGWYSHPTTRVLEQLAEHTGLDFGATAAQAHRHATGAALLANYPNTRNVGAALLMPSSPEATPGLADDDPILQPKSKSPQPASTKKGKTASVTDTASTEHSFCLAPQADLLQQLYRQLKEDDGSLQLPQLITTCLRAMHEGIGLNRVIFATLSPERTRLQARAARGCDNDPRFSRFVVDLKQERLFAALLQKPQALWVTEENAGRYLPLLSASLREHLGVKSFYLFSVFVDNKSVGVFYADRHSSHSALDERSFNNFKQLARQTTLNMERLAGRSQPKRAS